MSLKSDLLGWFQKHWKVFSKRPANGRTSMLAIESHLKDIRKERKRMAQTTRKIVKETSRAKTAIEEGHVVTDRHH